MYNLYKQYFVHTENQNARVINSNEIIEERRREQQRKEERRKMQQGGSFEAGIVGADTEVIEEVDLVEQAKEEAERILKEARRKADDIMNQADADAETLREEAKEQGYREGVLIKENELVQEKEQLEKEVLAKKTKLDADYLEKLETMERELIDVITAVFNKVFHIQFDDKKQILMHLVSDAILNIEGDRKFRIKISENHILFLENHREDILERVGHGIELEFVADSSMDEDDCLIETDSGIFECSLGTQMENLIKDIKSLCS